jgi:hypothetical protein
MGYTTTFKGVLKFKKELTTSALGKLSTFLGEDCRDHPEWGATHLTYIDLQLTKDFQGLEWDGSEKTYELEEKVNLLIEQMQKDFPDFALEGELSAQGEEPQDRWTLSIQDGEAVRIGIPLANDEIVCPDCGHLFKLKDAKKK